MTKPNPNNLSEGKRFQLVKYFAVASFIVLIIVSFPYSVFISKKAKDILTESYKDYALLVGENLSYQILQNYFYPLSEQFESSQLSNPKQRELMDRVIKNAIHSLNIETVNLYDISKNLIAYSTTPELIGKTANETPEYTNATMGKPTAGLTSDNTTIWGFGIDKLGAKKEIRAFIPMILENQITGDKYISTVIELILDLTDQYRSIVKFQFLILGLTIIIMGLIFIALLLIVRKAENIIEMRAREQRELEEQLHLSERLASLGEMVAGVSHEIKNPLGIIKSTSELLSTMPEAGETQKRLSDIITEESMKLNRIVTEFLDFARPQSLNISTCRLEDIIEKTISFLTPEFKKNNVVISNNLDGRSLKLQADQDLLYRALMNIFINSIQAMADSGGLISIDIKEEKDYYTLIIDDNGKGIDPENIRKIFNPFFTTKDKGSGLGLAIVKKIIEGHKGTIGIEQNDHSGTRVKIDIPKRNK